jgi:hypothetical protein
VDGLGNKDPRKNALPHTTVLYIEEKLTKKNTNEAVKQLSKLKAYKPVTLDIKEITNWKHKIVAILDTSPVLNIKDDLESLFSEIPIKVNKKYKKLYGNTIGDHMKLARQVKANKIDETISFFKRNIPSKITFERMALIGYKTEEKNILWDKELTK